MFAICPRRIQETIIVILHQFLVEYVNQLHLPTSAINFSISSNLSISVSLGFRMYYLMCFLFFVIVSHHSVVRLSIEVGLPWRCSLSLLLDINKKEWRRNKLVREGGVGGEERGGEERSKGLLKYLRELDHYCCFFIFAYVLRQ